ncbi:MULTISPECIES: glucosyl-3-phosphoglycerate synthase [Frankiaceae]|uniref:Glucosyl-3-phosphoglycerate synthase n=1 Tax=Candidatus Protofrankia datiscae TaxID=2716812 RepID=F8AZE8_9ACTN|nr:MULTISPECIES: glucosyl-3-phosphoglycerate synthase [Protofrankia]AEH11686.1 glycosyl transferase family 2 [Candidatus Protofrankia datiscae]
MRLSVRTVVRVRSDVYRWFEHRTYYGRDFSPGELLARKVEPISVVLPALNEAATVGAIVSAVRRDLVVAVPLIDEIVVIDPGSVDATASEAAAAGASVFAEERILTGYGRVAGKGEALWKSLYATSGDIVVFVDADLEDFDASLVTGLLGPLLTESAVSYVKASYDRPLAGGLLPGGGGRVTELVARPLLNLHWPQLAGLVQPLAGEFAGRRALLEQLPFVSGYGIEFAQVVDVCSLLGVDALAQVEVGRKVHRHQSDEALGRMAAEIIHAAWTRLGVHTDSLSGTLTQFGRGDSGLEPRTHQVAVRERPPMITIPEYAARYARLYHGPVESG